MLENTLYTLKKNKKLTIGYIGGSITEGACATDVNKGSYRALITSWFGQKFPEADVREINAAISGTGSELGMHRCEADLLSGNPDLVFMEFAANDYGLSYEKVCAQYETIIRKIYLKNPFADIVVLLTIIEGVCKDMEKGIEFASRNAQITIAHQYKLPVIDMGVVPWATTMREGGDFLRYTADTVHPNDEGHSMYANVVCNCLEELLDKEVPASRRPAQDAPGARLRRGRLEVHTVRVLCRDSRTCRFGACPRKSSVAAVRQVQRTRPVAFRAGRRQLEGRLATQGTCRQG